jgi:hypothetical protein
MSVEEAKPDVKDEASSMKDEAGPHFWYVLEKVISKISDNPSKGELARATKTMDHIAESYPCEECVENYNAYKKEHPLKCKNREECAEYLCEFHNDVRRRQGKSVRECKSVDKDADCPNCKTHGSDSEESNNEPVEQQGGPSPEQIGSVKAIGDGGEFPGIDHDAEIKLGSVVPRVGKPVPVVHKSVEVSKVSKRNGSNIISHKATSLQELKNVTRRIVEEMCAQHGAPVPELIFNSCPSNSKTSCTRVPVDLDGNMVKEVPTKLYFDPHSYSPRSIVHEVSHYIAKWSGDDKLFKDEIAIDKIARQVIDAGFTEHQGPSNTKLADAPIPMPSQMAQVASDIFSEGPNWLSQSFKERADKRLNEWRRNFPTFSRIFSGPATDTPAPVAVNTNPEPAIKAEPPPDTPQGSHYTDGFLSMIDPVFAPVANLTGLHPRDVTDAHIPSLIGNAVTTLAESNLNDFGALLISASTAGLTLLLGVLAKDSMGMGDRRFVMGLGGNLLWNSLGYIANPKKSKNVFSHANQFGKAISIMDMPGIQHCMSYEATVTTAGAGASFGKGVKNMTPEQIRGLQINQGFQPDVPLQNSYPLQGASTGGIGAPYGGRAIAGSADNRPYAGTGGARPYGNLDSEFDEFSLEENNRIARTQRSAFAPAIA